MYRLAQSNALSPLAHEPIFRKQAMLVAVWRLVAFQQLAGLATTSVRWLQSTPFRCTQYITALVAPAQGLRRNPWRKLQKLQYSTFKASANMRPIRCKTGSLPAGSFMLVLLA